MAEFRITAEPLNAAFAQMRKNLGAATSRKVKSQMFREGIRIARKAYREVIPRRTGLAQRKGLRAFVRKARGVPYYAVVGAYTSGGASGIRIHWTDAGTQQRTTRSGANRGANTARRYVDNVVARISPQILNAMRGFAVGAASTAMRKTADAMRRTQPNA